MSLALVPLATQEAPRNSRFLNCLFTIPQGLGTVTRCVNVSLLWRAAVREGKGCPPPSPSSPPCLLPVSTRTPGQGRSIKGIAEASNSLPRMPRPVPPTDQSQPRSSRIGDVTVQLIAGRLALGAHVHLAPRAGLGGSAALLCSQSQGCSGKRGILVPGTRQAALLWPL